MTIIRNIQTAPSITPTFLASERLDFLEQYHVSFHLLGYLVKIILTHSQILLEFGYLADCLMLDLDLSEYCLSISVLFF